MRFLKTFILSFFIVFSFTSCSKKEYEDNKIKKAIINYLTPYTNIEIFKVRSIEILSKKRVSKNEFLVKVRYTLYFKEDYKELADYIKKHPKSSLAIYDIGSILLLGRKFPGFKKGDIKTRIDIVKIKKTNLGYRVISI
ncbi:hypothetical protein [Nitrosophilus labii]|uniref:hypothetical protein n=1 Tax=Nitrosophilus labii TaxID=2706014 RepID=UPI001656B785|nr:hypothetical protein [Nitrosophilus labii]